MKILLTGGTGLLGKALIETNKHYAQILALYLGKYNMENSNSTVYLNRDILNNKIFEDKEYFDVVVHTAGVANTDFCEKNFKKAWQSNVLGTAKMIEICRVCNSKMVYISSNAIFDGTDAPYSEESVPNPINNYGRIKLECENLVKNSGIKYLIARPILMYGWNNEDERSNPATWLLRKLRSNEKVYMVNDIYENPLLNHNCAEIIWSLIKLDKEGIYHIAGKDVVNRYDFAKIVADIFFLDKNLIVPVSSDFFSEIAPRPRNTSYTTKKIEKELGIEPLSLKEGLLYMKKIENTNFDGQISTLECQR